MQSLDTSGFHGNQKNKYLNIFSSKTTGQILIKFGRNSF